MQNKIHWGSLLATPSQRSAIKKAVQASVGVVPTSLNAEAVTVTLRGADAAAKAEALEKAFPKDHIPLDEHHPALHDYTPAPMQQMAGEAPAPLAESATPTATVTLVGKAARMFLNKHHAGMTRKGVIPHLPSNEQMR